MNNPFYFHTPTPKPKPMARRSQINQRFVFLIFQGEALKCTASSFTAAYNIHCIYLANRKTVKHLSFSQFHRVLAEKGKHSTYVIGDLDVTVIRLPIVDRTGKDLPVILGKYHAAFTPEPLIH